jgi:hypothetical protein
MRADVTPQQIERPAEARGELLQRQVGDSCGGQLECQRKPVQLADDAPHLVVVERRRGAHRSGAGHEHRAGRSVVEPAQVDDLLARRPQRLARGRQDLEVGTARKEGGGQFRRSLDHMLASVEDEQASSPRQIVADEIDLVPRRLGQLECPSHSGGDIGIGRHSGELHEPHLPRA